MVTAVILINVTPGDTARVASELAEIPRVSEVYSVAGHYDLVALARMKENEELADLMADRVRKIPGITRTETLIAFRAYSRHDLESLFGVN